MPKNEHVVFIIMNVELRNQWEQTNNLIENPLQELGKEQSWIELCNKYGTSSDTSNFSCKYCATKFGSIHSPLCDLRDGACREWIVLTDADREASYQCCYCNRGLKEETKITLFGEVMCRDCNVRVASRWFGTMN